MSHKITDALSLIVVLLIATTVGLFLPQRIRMLCVNSSAPNVQSMCVKCDAGKFQQMSTACTGQPDVPANTTQTQAFCLLSTCLQQVRQQGQAIGRKKRLVDDEQRDGVTISTDLVDNVEDNNLVADTYEPVA